jgi:hypothetical protein
MNKKKSGKYFQINLKLMIMTDYWQSKVDFGTIKRNGSSFEFQGAIRIPEIYRVESQLWMYLK